MIDFGVAPTSSSDGRASLLVGAVLAVLLLVADPLHGDAVVVGHAGEEVGGLAVGRLHRLAHLLVLVYLRLKRNSLQMRLLSCKD